MTCQIKSQISHINHIWLKLLRDVLYFFNIFIIENSLILTIQEIVQNISKHTSSFT